MNWELYKNFSKAEFDCKHSGKNEMRPEFMNILQEIRTEYARVMSISSGYRDITHPIEARKLAPGEHSYGVAADIRVRTLKDVIELMQIAWKHGIRRMGLSQHKDKGYFLHLGMGDQLVDPSRFVTNSIWTY